MSRIQAKHDRVIMALLSCPSVKAAAEKSKVSERHIWRLLKLEDFRSRYQKIRCEMTELATSKIQATMLEAATTLQSIMADKNTKASVRVSAARAILDIGLRSWELADIENRISDLENKLKSQNRTGK